MVTKEQEKIKMAFYLTPENRNFIKEGSKMMGLSATAFINYLIWRFIDEK